MVSYPSIATKKKPFLRSNLAWCRWQRRNRQTGRQDAVDPQILYGLSGVGRPPAEPAPTLGLDLAYSPTLRRSVLPPFQIRIQGIAPRLQRVEEAGGELHRFRRGVGKMQSQDFAWRPGRPGDAIAGRGWTGCQAETSESRTGGRSDHAVRAIGIQPVLRPANGPLHPSECAGSSTCVSPGE